MFQDSAHCILVWQVATYALCTDNLQGLMFTKPILRLLADSRYEQIISPFSPRTPWRLSRRPLEQHSTEGKI